MMDSQADPSLLSPPPYLEEPDSQPIEEETYLFSDVEDEIPSSVTEDVKDESPPPHPAHRNLPALFGGPSSFTPAPSSLMPLEKKRAQLEAQLNNVRSGTIQKFKQGNCFSFKGDVNQSMM